MSMQFPKRAAISFVCVYLDHKIDESYTPKKITIRTGTTTHDLNDIISIELNEPTGWVIINLNKQPDSAGSDNAAPGCEEPLKTHFLQLKIMSMHAGGKDTHVRQIKAFGPRATTFEGSFSTIEMRQYASIR
jgi:anaphase-promoting complex subunit 10